MEKQTVQQEEIADPIVIFRYSDSPGPMQPSECAGQRISDLLDWSRLRREASLVPLPSDRDQSLEDKNVDLSLQSAGTTSDESVADERRLQISWDGEHSEGSSESNRSTVVSPAFRKRSRSVPYTNRRMLKSLPADMLSKVTRKALVSTSLGEMSLVYHGNMARKFPGLENRTPEQQKQRQRNTEAARISRRKTKLLEQLVEKETQEVSSTNTRSKRMVAAQLVYVNTLTDLLDLPRIRLKAFDGHATDDIIIHEK
ncbi:uncharacterized protein LOC128268520 [Anopheles cruzii]|uniref:uncharacterized protein LOC128268520 n=1 Tax=Anopheles cruzii TaxID=68878 RepID=UPI0022EC41A3|nr:uncharacterized protein LOC128268520 [Anopheles cruzii]